jgi:hypothetical protein
VRALGDREPVSVPNWHRDYTAAPEEGSYLWHLQRLHNVQALSLVVYHSAYEIRERQLYRPQYRSWAEFCRTELEATTNHVNRLIVAAGIAEELRQAGCYQLPRYPSQVRPLNLLPPFLRVTAWERACAGKSPGHSPSRADVMREVRKLLPPTTVTTPEERQICRDLLACLRTARGQIREAQSLYSSPEAETWLLDRATVKQRRLLRQLVEDCRKRLDGIDIDTRIIS